MIPRIQRQGRLLGFFLLGAVLPLALMAALLLGGVALALWHPSAGGLVAGAFLLSNGTYGLIQAFRSFPRPQGRPLRPEEAPRLFAHLDELAEGWKGPRTRDLVLDPGYWSLDLVGAPTLGLLGWTRFRWLMGVNPLLALSPREFEVLASWELVWWSDQQGWLGLQVKRVAAYWHRIGPQLEAQREAVRPWRLWLLAPYGRWIRKRLEPYLVEELFSADIAVARHFGSGSLARALSRLAILKPLLERRVFHAWGTRIEAGASLPDRLYPELSRVLARWPEGADALLELALDGHIPEAPPLLRLRLEQLSEAPTLPLPNLRAPLGEELAEAGLLDEFEGHWREGLRDLAERRRSEARAEAARFQELQGRTALEAPEALERLRLGFKHLSPEAWEPLLNDFLNAHPKHREARILAHRHFLRQGRRTGVCEGPVFPYRDSTRDPGSHLIWKMGRKKQ